MGVDVDSSLDAGRQQQRHALMARPGNQPIRARYIDGRAGVVVVWAQCPTFGVFAVIALFRARQICGAGKDLPATNNQSGHALAVD